MPRSFVFGTVLVVAAIALTIAFTREFTLGFEASNLLALGLILFLAMAGMWFMAMDDRGTAQKLAGLGITVAIAISTTGWFLAAAGR